MVCALCVRCPCAPTAAAVRPPPLLLPRTMALAAGLVHSHRQAVVEGIFVTRVSELNWGQVQPKSNKESSRTGL